MVYPETTGPFYEESQHLYQQLQSFSKQELVDKQKVSNSIAQKLYNSYHSKPTYGNTLYSYTGTSFSQLQLGTWTKDDRNYADEHIRIISALYGVLRPRDSIQHHRLDFTDSLLGINLYEYWKSHIQTEFGTEKCIINLASQEYAKIFDGWFQGDMVTCDFYLEKEGKRKVVAIHAKKQRGKMVEALVKNKVTDFDFFKKYSSDGFSYDNEASTGTHVVYVKNDN
jgi:cytoplasmic iron level regulating protein YaaA (DUF328/UPF0246 family)